MYPPMYPVSSSQGKQSSNALRSSWEGDTDRLGIIASVYFWNQWNKKDVLVRMAMLFASPKRDSLRYPGTVFLCLYPFFTIPISRRLSTVFPRFNFLQHSSYMCLAILVIGELICHKGAGEVPYITLETASWNFWSPLDTSELPLQLLFPFVSVGVLLVFSHRVPCSLRPKVPRQIL